MDIAAHMLWAGLGTLVVARRLPLTRRGVAATVALAAMPDLLQYLPVLAWVGLGGGSWHAVRELATALPGHEPALPPAVALVSHHLHCAAHSALVAGVVTALAWATTRAFWFPLLGWWSHILIDVFTHSADFYPAPVLYPLTYSGFDGVAWNEPWFMALNYAALGLAWWWALRSCAKSSRPGAAAPTIASSPQRRHR